MAKAQGSATMEAPREATLDASMEHPALTPLVRRLAGELWEIVQTKAEAEGLPIEKAWLFGYTDVEAWTRRMSPCFAPRPPSGRSPLGTGSTTTSTSGSPR